MATKTKKIDNIVSVNLETIAKRAAATAVRTAVNSYSQRHIKDYLGKHCKVQATAFAKQWLADNQDKINAQIKKAVDQKLKDEQQTAIDKAVKSVKITANTTASRRRW